MHALAITLTSVEMLKYSAQFNLWNILFILTGSLWYAHKRVSCCESVFQHSLKCISACAFLECLEEMDTCL